MLGAERRSRLDHSDQERDQSLPSRCSPALHPANDVGRPHCSELAVDFLTTFEEHQRRDAADTELSREVLLGLGVHFGQAHSGLKLLRGRSEVWRHGLARTTPGSPEIHDDRNVAAANVPLESGTRELDRMTGKQNLVALATLGLLIEACTGNAVNRLAMRADDVHYFAHVNNGLPDHQRLKPAMPDSVTQPREGRRNGRHFVNGVARRCFKTLLGLAGDRQRLQGAGRSAD